MSAAFAVVGSVLALVAALIHLYIFFLESVLWTRPSTMATFGVRDAKDAEVLRPMAFNQGFYNVFLALGTGIGLVLLGTGASREGGIAIAMFALGSMVLAAVVLVASNPKMLRAALIQGAAPLLALLFLLLSLLVA
jgi:putative membrane protein